MHTATPPPMRYPMCGGQELRTISSDYVDKIVARNEILDDVVDQLLTTAVTQREYTRSVAYVVVLMSNILHKRNCDENLRKHFLQKFCHSAILEFENYDWKNTSEDNYELDLGYSSIDALALSALIGDLTSLKLISYNRFKTLMGLLIGRIEICLHVECIHTLLSHAAARPTPEMAPPFLYECIRTVRRHTNLCIVPHINRFPEETRNFETFVRQHLVNRTAPEFPSYCDMSLNLEDALTSSVCVGPLRNRCASPIYC